MKTVVLVKSIMHNQKVSYLKGDDVVGSNVVTIELQPLLVVTVRARGGRDSAGLLGTCSHKYDSQREMSAVLYICALFHAYI
jgi:hypothetical protein